MIGTGTSRARSDASETRGPLPLQAPLPPSADRAVRERRLAELHARVHTCTRCVAAGYLASNTSIAGFRGRIGDRVMLVGQAPGHLSVERGQPFTGPGGRILDGWLRRAGFAPGALWSEVYISAITKCDPGKGPRGGGDRKPSPAEQALCRPFLLAELELVRPRVILPVGGMAIDAFLGPSKLDAVIGQAFERDGVRILPLPHPSGVSRWLNAPAHQALLAQALDILAGWRREWEHEEERGEQTAEDAVDAEEEN